MRKFSTFFNSIQTTKLNGNFKHNIQYVDKIVIEIFNPKTVKNSSIFRNNIYNAEIKFDKDNITLYKKIASNDYEDLVNKMNLFIDSEIKI